MNIVLLSGGSGQRLWPLSNDIRSKQFIKIFRKDADGEEDKYESMIERMYAGILKAMPDASVTVGTGKAQVSSLLNQLGDGVDICVEPARRDTFPAICLAASYLKDIKGVRDEEPVVVCPVDPFVEDGYFLTLKKLGEAAKVGDSNLYLMGIKPTYPSEKYGYILTDGNNDVRAFKEKPDQVTAQKYLEAGAFWNGGVFAFKLSYMLKKAHELIDFTDYHDLRNKYLSIEKISFDYAVVEKEKSVSVIPYDGEWKDLGTWNTLTEAMSDKTIGEAYTDDTCSNTHIVNELDIPILAMGLKDTVVAASADGILVADKHQSSYMKPYVENLAGPVKYAEKSWGSYRVMDIEPESMTVKVTLLPGHKMNYHSHERRDEVWNVLEGTGTVILDGVRSPIVPGDVIKIPVGVKHTVIADTTLKIMEIQIGTEISVNDKIKHDV